MKTKRTRVFLASGLLTAATLCLADPPVLRWNGPAIGTNVWDAATTNWLDAAESAVAWQPGSEARFDGAGGSVDVAENVVASNLTFATGGYALGGLGLLTVEGGLSAAASTENTISAELHARAALTKTGDGTITLTNPDALLTNAFAVSAGTLALQDTAIPGSVSVASGADVTALPASANGLMGFYYNVTPNSANFASLAAMEAHFSTLTPDLAVPSSQAGATFDFGSTGTLFPLPYAYGSGGSRTNYFEVVWRGTLTIPASDFYTFRITHDDGLLLALDGKQVISRLANAATEATTFLDAGPHDMVLGLYQGTGSSAMQVQIKSLYGSFAMLPNAWLKPYTAVGALSGNGSATLAASGSSFKASPVSASTFTGELTSPSGSLFTKGGWGALTLASANATSNALAGDVAVQGGTLALATGERIGDTSTVRIGDNASLTVAASETLGALAGSGTVTLGNGAGVRVLAFSGDADCGLSTNKTYTHLLDFPDNGSAATVNGVAFISAGTSGSTNGYAWSATGNPPTGTWADGGTGVAQLIEDFTYGGTDYTLTLSGLTPGQSYETRLYFRSFGSVNPNSPRKLTFFFTSGSAFIGSLYYSPDAEYARSMLCCRYTADAAGTLSVRVLVHNSGHTCHVYGLSNEKTAAPEAPAAPAATYPRVVAFTGDADSGFSTGKTYTHLLDFPANGNPATVNGVDFLAAGMSGSAFGYGWNTNVNEKALNLSWNDAQGIGNDSARGGIDRLLWDFQYNSTNFTLCLTGLTPGRTYEARLYFRSFGNPVANSPRDIIATFAAGAAAIGSTPHDLDTIARSRIECRYTADTAGTLSINIVSPNSGSTCHLYGLSNEELNEPSALTLNTPAESAARHIGAVTGSGTLVKQGAGTQTLGGAVRLSSPVDVQAGTLVFEPGASVLSGAVVRAGATLAAPSGNVWLGGLSGAGTFSLAGVPPYPVTNLISFTTFTNDLTTGLSPSKTYTHLLDFGTRAPAAVINGVTFTKVASQNGSANGFGWSNFPPSSHGGNAPPIGHSVPEGSGAYDLLYDMDYGWSWPDPKTMQLTGLTPGKRYEVRLYNRAWGWTGSRTQTVSFDPDGAGPITESATFNPDAMDANFLSYRYTPTSATLNIIVQSSFSNQTYHLYGLSNEEASDATYAPVTVDLAQDSLFSGLVTGAGAWAKTGAGTLTLAATNDATGALAVEAGALAVTGGATATLGPVTVAAGATLTGDGRVGGDVAVLSNATLRAGTASACGTLAVGGNLTLAAGALPLWRFANGATDLILVGGTLTFPTNGVLQVATLTPGLRQPDVAPVFTSSHVISGPASLAGWTVEGVNNARLLFSTDRKTIYFLTPRGTMILVR
jgi:autotransporter-associated beta strand protein